MPGFDKTGPNGQGSRTGWGQGNCPTQDAIDIPMTSRKRGFRIGAGKRQGMGRRMRNHALTQDPFVANNVAAEITQELQNQIETLKEQITELTIKLGQARPENTQKS